MKQVRVYLTRRNLLGLLEKLDHVMDGGLSACSIFKQDTVHSKYPITGTDGVMITAVEDDDYYNDRPPGDMTDLKTGEIK